MALGPAQQAFADYMANMRARYEANPQGDVMMLNGAPFLRGPGGQLTYDSNYSRLQLASEMERVPAQFASPENANFNRNPAMPTAPPPPAPSPTTGGLLGTSPTSPTTGAPSTTGGTRPATEYTNSPISPTTSPPGSGTSLGSSPWLSGRTNFGTVGTNSGQSGTNYSGGPWTLGGNFSGTNFPVGAITGFNDWNPNDPRSQNPGTVARQDGTISFQPRKFADTYGGGIAQPFKNAADQYWRSLVSQAPLQPTYSWLQPKSQTAQSIGDNGMFSSSMLGGLLGTRATPR